MASNKPRPAHLLARVSVLVSTVTRGHKTATQKVASGWPVFVKALNSPQNRPQRPPQKRSHHRKRSSLTLGQCKKAPSQKTQARSNNHACPKPHKPSLPKSLGPSGKLTQVSLFSPKTSHDKPKSRTQAGHLHKNPKRSLSSSCLRSTGILGRLR